MKQILASIMIFLGGANLPATGQSFSDGLNAYNAGNYIAAYENFKPLAEQGDASTQYILGYMYYNGQGVLQDYAEAVKWYRLAAEQGDASAKYQLGVMYDYGQGVLRDEAEAMKWYRLAAYQGNADAQNAICKSRGYKPNTRAIGDCMMQVASPPLTKARHQPRQAAALSAQEETARFEPQRRAEAEILSEEAQARLASFHSQVAQARHQARQAAALAAQEEIVHRERQRRAEAQILSEQAQVRHQAQLAAALRAQEEIARRERQRRAEAGFWSAMTQFGLNMALGNTNSFSLPPSTSSSSPSAGFFQTCRYNVMGEVVSTSQSSASLCPISRRFNGRTGYLVN